MQVQLAAKVQGYHLYAQNPSEYGRHGYGSHYVSNRTMCLPALGGMIGIGSTPTNAQAFDTDKKQSRTSDIDIWSLCVVPQHTDAGMF